MRINHKGKQLELSFGFRFINTIDRINGTRMEQDGQNLNFGSGLESFVPMLQTGSPVLVGRAILAATQHHKKAPTMDDLDEILNDIAENVGLQEFADEIIEELGKQPMTRNIVSRAVEDELETKKAKKEKK